MTPRYGFESLFPHGEIIQLETGRVVGIITAVHTSAEFRLNAQGENKMWACNVTVEFALTGDPGVLRQRELEDSIVAI